jgi:hypothetical protein
MLHVVNIDHFHRAHFENINICGNEYKWINNGVLNNGVLNNGIIGSDS